MAEVNGMTSNEHRDRLVLSVAEYYVNNKSTVRKTAEKFKISKSTVYTYLTKRLVNIDLSLHREVKTILEWNKSERHIRGGSSYKKKQECKKKNKAS